jgi:hypothetical protein
MVVLVSIYSDGSSFISNSFAGIPVVGAMTALDGVKGTVCNAQHWQYDQSQSFRHNGYPTIAAPRFHVYMGRVPV